MRAFIATLLLVTALAGCLGGGDGTDNGDEDPITAPSDWHLRATYGVGVDPAEIDYQDGTEVHQELHDHANRSQHVGLSTPNFEVVGWDPMVTDRYDQNAGGYFCGGVGETTDGRTLSVVNSFTSAVAIAIVDVTDPAAPFLVGELALPRAHIYDATITSDGQYAVFSVSPEPADDDVPSAPLPVTGLDRESVRTHLTFTDACGNEYAGPEADLAWGPGTMLVDITDPADPIISDMAPAPVLAPHSVSTVNIDGTEFAASSTTNLQYEASYFQFFTVETLATGGKLAPYSTYTAQYAQGEAETIVRYAQGESDEVDTAFSLLNGHVDATIYKHPVTDQILAGLSNWDGGMVTIDISDPGAVVPVSTWGARTDATISHSGAIHSVSPVPEMWGDRFLVLAGQEVLGSYNAEPHRASGQITLLDMTDPAAPEPVARWTLPMEMHWSGPETFSTHYFTVVDDVLFVAMYHGGVWAVDLAEDQWPELPSLGVFLPDNQPEEPALTRFAFYSPTVLDVFALDDGRLLTYDAESGAYVVEFTKDTDVPVIAPWTEDAWIDA